jgi:hypothetical protein
MGLRVILEQKRCGRSERCAAATPHEAEMLRTPKMPGLKLALSTLMRAAALGITLTAIGGCGTNAKADRDLGWQGETLLNDAPLVLAADEAPIEGDWEYARRDRALGAAGSPFLSVISAAEIRHYERLRDVNGRPRNHSWTYSRSIQRRIGP